MKSVFEVMGAVAGIGGLSLGVFLYLFRGVLTKIKPQTLTPELWYQLIHRFMIYVFSIAVIGILVYLATIIIGKSQAEEVNKKAYIKDISTTHDTNKGEFSLVSDAEVSPPEKVKELDETKDKLEDAVSSGDWLGVKNYRNHYNITIRGVKETAEKKLKSPEYQEQLQHYRKMQEIGEIQRPPGIRIPDEA